MTILDLLRQEHEEVKSLLERAEATKDLEGTKREQLVAEIKEKLIPHSRAEEQTLYDRLNQTDDEARDLVDEAKDEHAEAELLIRDLDFMDPSSSKWMPTLKKLKRSIEHHVREEESEMFTKAENILSEQEFEEALIEYHREKQAVFAIVS